MRVWLDDVRPMPENFDVWCKEGEQCIPLIKANKITHLSFDHDLGIKTTGYDLAKFIEVTAFVKGCNPFTWDIHSANPVGRKNIEQAMKSAERFWRQ